MKVLCGLCNCLMEEQDVRIFGDEDYRAFKCPECEHDTYVRE